MSSRSQPRRQGGAAVGHSPLAREFFAGRYARVVAATFDAPQTRFADDDVAFAVGALTFLGRRDDAEACFQAWRSRGVPNARTLAASRFFLGVAHARAGSFTRGHELLVQHARRNLKSGDAWATAFVFQGLACQRYFTGRYHAAARHALRALRSAHAARFAYVRLLATDLRGHALVQVGRGHSGLALLEQAQRLAQQLGLELNAFAIECSIATYAVKFGVEPELVGRLEQLLERVAHDSYSRHALLTEYAGQLALRGRATEARAALSRADDEALRRDVRRGRVSNLLAHLHVARWAQGASACAELLEQAKGLVDDSDVTFRAELACFEAFVASKSNDGARFESALTELRQLATSHDLHWAKAGLEQFAPGPYQSPAFPEDRVTPLLRAAATRDESALHRLLSAGLTGAVPELLGLAPGRRILVLATENALLLESNGDVVLRPNPPRWCSTLLRLLSTGDVSKEALVSGLWGLRAYRPERHDPLLRTTIHRLRAVLEPFGAWVRVTPRGYGTMVPVVFVGADEGASRPLELSDLESEPDGAPIVAAAPTSPVAAPRERALRERIVSLLAEHEQLGVKQVAARTGVSVSTALRALRQLTRERRVRRAGYARATRYSLGKGEQAP